MQNVNTTQKFNPSLPITWSNSPISRFFFNPLHENHSKTTKLCASVVFAVLSIFSIGVYPLLITVAHRFSLSPVTKVTSASPSAPSLPKHLQEIVDKQIEQIKKFEGYFNKKDYIHLQTHTHEDGGFDWWTFPINTRSNSYEMRFTVTSNDIEALKAYPGFKERYLKLVFYVAKAWGWDLEQKKDITSNKLKWEDWPVRLDKMSYSLALFGETKILKTLAILATARLKPSQMFRTTRDRFNEILSKKE